MSFMNGPCKIYYHIKFFTVNKSIGPTHITSLHYHSKNPSSEGTLSYYHEQVDFDQHLLATDRSSHGFGHACGPDRSGQMSLIEISCGWILKRVYAKNLAGIKLEM